MTLELGSGDALLVVDCQNDFFPGGALPVPMGDAILPAVNALIAAFADRGLPIVLTRDWHPPDHCSFEAQGGPWPVHCVRGTGGAELRGGLAVPSVATIVHKATAADRDAYSAFDGTGLGDHLRAHGVRRTVIAGLTLDYCVRESGLDALTEGFQVVVPLAGTRAVNASPGDGDAAIEALRDAGAVIIAGD